MDIKDKKTRFKILGVLFSGVLMGALDIAIIGPAMPAIQAYFKVDERLLAWIFSIYVLFNLVGTPLMAKLSDLFGRKPVYLVDVALFAAGSLIVALSPDFTFVLVGRGIQGFGAGGIFPVASAVIGDTFPPEKRGSALGLIGTVFGLAFIIGPILGGILLLINWHWLFIVNLPIAALVLVFSARILPASKPQKPVSFDWQGMLTLGFSLGALAYGINQIDSSQILPSFLSTRVWPFLLASLIAALVFIHVERSAQSPILSLSLFNKKQMILDYLLAAGSGLGEAALVYIPGLAVLSLGITSSQSSFLLLPLVLAAAIASPLIGQMLDRRGSKVVIVTGTLLYCLGLFSLSQFAGNFAVFLVSAAFTGGGLSVLLGAPLRYIMLNEALPQERSIAQGTITLFGSIGQLLGGVMVGAITASGGGKVSGFQNAYMIIGVIAVFMVIISLGLKSQSAEKETMQRTGLDGASDLLAGRSASRQESLR